jgi:hypothetical protein
VLKAHRPVIGYPLGDLKGISPDLCMHKINLEEDVKPVIDYQRRLNPKLKEVVRKDVLKLWKPVLLIPLLIVSGF